MRCFLSAWEESGSRISPGSCSGCRFSRSTIRARKEWHSMSSSMDKMDKSHGPAVASPGYETRDANVRGVFSFLVVLGLALVFIALLCWGLFKYFSAGQATRAPASPFSETRQLPTGPQLQVNPRQDLLRFRAQQERSLESYSWESKQDGTVRVPIERAMEILLKQGLPVAPSALPAEGIEQGDKSGAKGSEIR